MEDGILKKLTAGFGEVERENIDFGSAVSIEGNYIAAGAPDRAYGKTDFSAYLFEYKNNQWVQKDRFTNSDDIRNEYGSSVSVSGNTMLVGGIRSGIAFLYDDIDYPKESLNFSASPEFVDIRSAEQTFVIQINNTGEADIDWSAETQEDWLEILDGNTGQNNGTITIKVSMNTGGIRTGSIVISVPDTPDTAKQYQSDRLMDWV